MSAQAPSDAEARAGHAASARLRLCPLDALVLLLAGAALFWLGQGAAERLNYRWNWAAIPQFLIYADAATGELHTGRLLTGLAATIRLSLWAGALALVLGTVAGLMRVSPRLFWRLCGGTYVLSVRNTPPLVLIFLFSYFLSGQLITALGLDAAVTQLPVALHGPARFLFGPLGQMPGFLTAIVTLGLIEGAYVAEIVRAGVQSVESGQWDAASALGFPRWRTLLSVILPQAFRRMLPPLTGQFVSTVKDSAIVSVISIPELTFQAQELVSATYLSFEVWTLVFLLYLGLGLPCSIAARGLEKRLARSDRIDHAGPHITTTPHEDSAMALTGNWFSRMFGKTPQASAPETEANRSDPMAPVVKVYALSTCIHCKKAKEYLDQCGVKYECVHVDQLTGEERKLTVEEVKKFNPSVSFPTIIINGEAVVGFNQEKIDEALKK
ncbi:MAG TPA: ABC transporter permease subunit [Humidesulfovibrio sp.]|uniref:ABC transporter permease subunit n=1 Tax=Humidesulfovibrio sp. TaxID=2910988 RepID=UPI002B5A6A06|nr:ABC transporter permease subunit [Humidesulfovibrio sp.]HWR04069.1 ABC transporter permease subunit [Humidesulfovibrio sp.]